jgi:hypothetical protein
VPDLALGHQLGQRAHGVLDRRVGIDPVLVVQVNVVGAEPLERALHGRADVGRAAVEMPRALARVRDHAELGGQHDLVALAPQRLPDQFLVPERTVDLGRVDERDAQLDRPMDGADRLGVIQVVRAVGPGHGHCAKADPGDVQVSQLDVLHRVAFLREQKRADLRVSRSI